ncbi:MAG TPA: alpha/beta fold hydrolase [Gemmatimonadaceae bacterium]|nr:alpha/beta fold hydrolase [Gemmatimonadaceae bacterium]
MSAKRQAGAGMLRRLGRGIVFAAMPLTGGALEARAQAPPHTERPPTVARLGSCRLASGATIPDCRVAYRAFGRLSAARDNVVLIPTFFAGRSEDHAFMLGTYVDTTRYHVIIADALADGHSSSPSNTPAPARRAFADLAIGDMVDAHRRLVEEHLGITRLRAVVGISMGGMQAFEWAVRHPTFADVVVSVVGTPRVAPFDRLIYRTLGSEAERASEADASPDSAWTRLSRLEALFMRTPAGVNDSGEARAAREIAAVAESYRRSWSLDDYAAQTRAMGRHDVAARFGGELSRAAGAVRARMLVVYSADDHMVSAGPAAEFARLAGADTLAVRSACGHSLFWCEQARVGAAVRRFLQSGANVPARRPGPPTR